MKQNMFVSTVVPDNCFLKPKFRYNYLLLYEQLTPILSKI